MVRWLYSSCSNHNAGGKYPLHKVKTGYETNFGENAPSCRVATAVGSQNYTNISLSLIKNINTSNWLLYGVTPESVQKSWATFPYGNLIKSVDPNDNVNYIVDKIGLAWGETKELDATNGYPGDYNIIWELPILRSVSAVGNVYEARIHAVDKFYPDAYVYNGEAKGTHPEYIYRFHVISEVAGISNLLAIHDDYINVFGCIYDDIWHTRPPDIGK